MEITHIRKSFGNNVVLQDVSLPLIPGKCIAICGHNGCGKSTLLNAVAGFLRIDSGELQLHNAVLQYIPDHFFTTRMNACDFLMHMGAIQGMDADTARAVIREYTHKFFMNDLLKTPMQYLSKGSLQKVAVIQALLQTPDILLMDEPLNGQDAASQRVFIELMEELKKKDVCILMAVHEQRLIKEAADIVYELQDGIAADGFTACHGTGICAFQQTAGGKEACLCKRGKRCLYSAVSDAGLASGGASS